MACRTIDLEFNQIGAPIPDLPNDADSVILDPGIGATQGVLEAPKVGFPSANLKVKIVSAISLSEGGLRAVV